MSDHVIVVGGGLAGISATLALREAGVRVSLFEGRPRLGGATHSFHRGDLVVDNGQHVFLRCCTAYQGLLDRLDVADLVRVQRRFDVTVLTPQGPPGRLRRSALPAPLHLLPTLARYRLLSPEDRLRTVLATPALARLDPTDPALDDRSVGAWLAAHGQRDRARRTLWELFVVASLNAGVDEAALGPAAMVIKTALLGRADAADVGVPLVPLGELHGRAARAAIERAGGRVHLKTKVQAIEPGPKVVVSPSSTEQSAPVTADAVVLAVPHETAAELVPPEAVPDKERWHGLGASPIVNVHVVYDRPVTDLPFAAVVDSPVQWVFDRTEIAGLRHGQYLAVSVSAADRWIDMPVADVRAAFVPELERVFPAARQARVTDVFVTRERRATFRQTPGSGALRPSAATGLPELFLAGAWTATGWPDTMEGAVRSGLNAAHLVLHRPTEEGRR